MPLIDMQLTAQEAKQADCYPGDGDDKGPKYPYGLSINLDDETLAKLGITTLPAVSSKMALQAVVEVTSTSQYERQDEKEININLQITAMELAGVAGPSAASVLYGGSGS